MQKSALRALSGTTILLFGLLWSLVATAAKFTAKLDTELVELGQSLTLSLTLEQTTHRKSPDLRPLEADFVIHQQHQSNQFQIINGSASRKITWQITLLPKHSGQLTIPAIAIMTRAGGLVSQPLAVQVTPAQTATGNLSPNQVKMEMVTPSGPFYMGQSFLVALRIEHLKEIANSDLDTLTLQDAQIERIEQPHRFQQVKDGQRVQIVEIHYVVTPLKAGNLAIPSLQLKGDLIGTQSRRGQLYDPFWFGSNRTMKPFISQSQALELKILPAPTATQPWLPLEALSLDEQWDIPETVHVGDPIIRTVTLTAKGAKAEQLPDAGEQFNHPEFKRYPDKAKLDTQVDTAQWQVNSTREQSITLMPTQPGKFTIPELTIPWWHVSSQQMKNAHLPSKTIEVKPALATTVPSLDYSNQQAEIPTGKPTTAFLIIIGLQSVCIIGLLAWVRHLLKKLKSQAPRLTEQDLFRAPRQLQTAQDLKQAILVHAIEQWGSPRRALPFSQLLDTLQHRGYQFNVDAAHILGRSLNDAMYANKQTDLAVLVKQWETFKASVHIAPQPKHEIRQTIKLNPGE